MDNNYFSILEWFKAIDIHDSGFIDLVSLKMFFKLHGHYLTDEDLAIIISRIGRVQELVITYASFSDHFETKDKSNQQRSNSRSPILQRKFIPSLKIYDIWEHQTTRSHKEQNKFSFNDDLTDSKENAKTSIDQVYNPPRISNLNILFDEQGLPQRYTEQTPSKEKSLKNEAFSGCFNDIFKTTDHDRTENINIENNQEYEESQPNLAPSPKELIFVPARKCTYRDTYSSYLRREIKSPKFSAESQMLKAVSIAKPKPFTKGK